MNKASRGRLRRALPGKLRFGWERAVFAEPQASAGGDQTAVPAEEIHPGPGVAETDAESDAETGAENDAENDTENDADLRSVGGRDLEAAIAELLVQAEEAAARGLTKQTIVVDARRRLVYDARHGHIKTKTLGEAEVAKVMGGKERLFRPDRSAAFLRAIGIMNADGTISTRHARKYKQVSHLAELCRPAWERILGQRADVGDAAPLRVLDLACGNAYLSFVIAEALRLAGIPLRLHGVDVRGELVARAEARAAELGIEGLTFAQGTIAGLGDQGDLAAAALGGPAELVIALHACDTATDEALELAIRGGAPAILCVPCCQHELAAQLATSPGPPLLPALGRHGLLRGAYADILTDAIRCDILSACGYQVDVVEFVGSEHTAKNLLIRASRRHRGPDSPDRWDLGAVAARCAELGVDPCLLRRLCRS